MAETKRGRGRPQAEIDKKQFEKLCALHCTQEEIAGVLDVSADTIERWCEREYGTNFAEIYEVKKGIGKMSLRRSQWKMSETNPTMAIWLGKQYLGQTDKQEKRIEVNSDGFLEALKTPTDNKEDSIVEQ